METDILYILKSIIIPLIGQKPEQEKVNASILQDK
jgi:hypothetical protein